MVVFERQHIACFLFDDLLGDAPLAPYGVDADHRTGQLQHVQQRRDSRDLIALVSRHNTSRAWVAKALIRSTASPSG